MRRFTRAARAIIGPAIFGPVLWLGAANAQNTSPPEVPDAIQPPPGEVVVLLAHASGSQVYACHATDGKFTWTLTAPEAELTDQQGKVIGSHSAGPAWKLNDGSEVTGKATAHADSPDPGSVPWLLVNAVGHAGKGLLTNVTTIQRVHTHGGKPPAEGCDESHQNLETKSAYTADYYFYAPKK